MSGDGAGFLSSVQSGFVQSSEYPTTKIKKQAIACFLICGRGGTRLQLSPPSGGSVAGRRSRCSSPIARRTTLRASRPYASQAIGLLRCIQHYKKPHARFFIVWARRDSNPRSHKDVWSTATCNCRYATRPFINF